MSHNATTSRSAELFERAKKVMPGGVSRNTVLWSAVPPYVAHGKIGRAHV